MGAICQATKRHHLKFLLHLAILEEEASSIRNLLQHQPSPAEDSAHRAVLVHSIQHLECRLHPSQRQVLVLTTCSTFLRLPSQRLSPRSPHPPLNTHPSSISRNLPRHLHLNLSLHKQLLADGTIM